MQRDSVDLARYIIEILSQKGEEYAPSNTKVQKLLYAYTGFALANKLNKESIINELPEAWQHGPVFPKVFHVIKNNDIKSLGKKIKLSKAEEKILRKTIDVLGRFSAGKLSTWSHIYGSPWYIVWTVQENEYGKIPLELIKEYFTNEVENII